MKTEIKFGIVFGIGICIYTILMHFLGFYTENIQAGKYSDIGILLLPIAVYFLALKEKTSRDGSLTLFTGIKSGLLIALISIPISTAFLWIYHHYINPNWLGFLLAFERNKMIREGATAQAMASRLNAIEAGGSDISQILGGIIGTIVLGLILSIIFSLVFRRRATS